MRIRLEETVVYRLRQASRVLTQQYLAAFDLKRYSISQYEWLVLILLQERDGQSQQQLGELCSKEKAGITRIIDGLETKGWVRRQQDPQDRRSNQVFLTLNGMEIANQLQIQTLKLEQAIEQKVSVKDLETTLQVLRLLEQPLQ